MSQKVRLAVQLVAAIATEGGQRIKLEAAAKLAGCSMSYAEQIVGSLVRAGVLHGTKGPGCGYSLGRPAHEITAADIVDAMGKMPIVFTIPDGAQLAWNRVSVEMHFALAGITVADMIARERRAAA